MKNLTSLRKKQNLTQAELARQLNFARSTLCQYEAGNREPDFATLEKIADYFHVSVDYLLGRDISNINVLEDNKLNDLAQQELSQEQSELLSNFNKLGVMERQQVFGHIEFLLSQQFNSKKIRLNTQIQSPPLLILAKNG